VSWNYRITRNPDSSGFALREVFYDDDGRPNGWTDPIIFAWPDEGPEGIAKSLELALKDARRLPVLDLPDIETPP
jgi:hypothetical protein